MKGRYRNIAGKMIGRYWNIAIFMATLLISCPAPLKEPARAGYKREIAFKTKPASKPYYLPLGLFDNSGIGFKLITDKDSIISHHRTYHELIMAMPSFGYFWALNDNRLAFINKSEGEIYILDLDSQKYSHFKPEVGEYKQLLFFWTGPEDDLYVLLRLNNRKPPYRDLGPYDNIRLFRFANDDGKYTYDDKSVFPVYNSYPSKIRISPLNNLYIRGWKRNSYSPNDFTKFNKYGQELENTDAVGETLDSVEFKLNCGCGPYNCRVSAKNMANDNYLYLELIPEEMYQSNFKYTLDNSLVITCQYRDSTNIDPDTIMFTNAAIIIGKNFKTKRQFILGLDSLDIEGYNYYSVSDISINYANEIYVSVVYFNDPGVITGDELIVMYRFRPVKDF